MISFFVFRFSLYKTNKRKTELMNLFLVTFSVFTIEKRKRKKDFNFGFPFCYKKNEKQFICSFFVFYYQKWKTKNEKTFIQSDTHPCNHPCNHPFLIPLRFYFMSSNYYVELQYRHCWRSSFSFSFIYTHHIIQMCFEVNDMDNTKFCV